MTRLYADREPIQVKLDAAGRPQGFCWRGGWHLVEFYCNHWRVADTWWSEPLERDYWRLATRDGLLAEIYLDMARGGWYLSRLYD